MAERQTTIAVLQDAWNRALAAQFKLEDVAELDASTADEISRKADAKQASEAAGREADILRLAILYQFPSDAADAMVLFWHVNAVAEQGSGDKLWDLATDAARDALGVWFSDHFAEHVRGFPGADLPGELGDMLGYARKRVAARVRGEI